MLPTARICVCLVSPIISTDKNNFLLVLLIRLVKYIIREVENYICPEIVKSQLEVP